MRLLLHTCCAPCVLPIIEYLKQKDGLDISLFFFNPNIFPEEEYNKRLKESEKVAQIYNMKLFVSDYNNDSWDKKIRENLLKSPENYKENEERCDCCFKIRMIETAEFATKNNFDAFATTLNISLFKNTKMIDKLGDELSKKYKLNFYQLNEIDPKLAYAKGKELAQKYNVYRQKYCGCKYSLN